MRTYTLSILPLGFCLLLSAQAAAQSERDPDVRAALAAHNDLRDLVGLLDRCDLFVGIDSGVLHLAAAVGKPCVALFGPTDPEQTGPQGNGHVVVRACEEGPGEMGEIDVAPVTEAIADVLGRTG